jgi:hypothetical protein
MEEQKLNPQQLQDLIKKMPPKTQEAYYAVSTANSIYEARQVSGIPDRLASKIAAKIADVMLGLLNPADLTHELVNLGIPEAVAANFYRLISQSIFLKIKNELDQIYTLEPHQTQPGSANIEQTILSPISPLSPESLSEPHQTRSEPSQQEENINVVKIKVEPPPLRRMGNKEVAEQAKPTKVESDTTNSRLTQSDSHQAQQSQPKINDPYREPIL